MEFINDFFESNTQMALISMGITALAHIFFALAVYFDTKINFIKFKTLWIIVALLFGAVPTGIYYIFRRILPTKVPIVCTKCGKKAPKNAKVCPKCGNNHFAPKHYEDVGAIKTRIIALLAAGVVLFAFDAWFTQYSPWAEEAQEQAEEELDAQSDEFYDSYYDEEASFRFGYDDNGQTVYFDREGKRYLDAYKVVLYDKDGNTYIYNGREYVSGKKSVSVEAALVDSNGYLVDAEAEFGNIPSSVPFKTADGTMYYRANDVSWNSSGKMVYTSNGNPIN